MITLKSEFIEVVLNRFGARIVSVFAPDRNGNKEDVVLGYDTIEEYVDGKFYHGAICGRVANRIAGGKFSIDGWDFQAATNNNGNTLHGGNKGLSGVFWSEAGLNETEVIFDYFSTHNEEGFPGNVHFRVLYKLEGKALTISLFAESDKPCPINLTSHPYFNLNGNGSIENHSAKFNSTHFIPINDEGIPTGEIAESANTPFDFNKEKLIGTDLRDSHEQIQKVKGYDHTFVTAESLQAIVKDPESGRVLRVYSTYPGFQFYTANTMKFAGKDGRNYQPYEAFCIEPQFFPDAINQAAFQDIVLRKGQTYYQEIIYEFDVFA